MTRIAGIPLEPLLAFEDALDVLRISRASLFRLIRDGQIESVRIGDRRLFERRAIEAFVAARREGGEG